MVVLWALKISSWTQYFFFKDGDLPLSPDGTLIWTFLAFVMSVLGKLIPFQTFIGVRRWLGVDAFQYLTVDKVYYVA